MKETSFCTKSSFDAFLSFHSLVFGAFIFKEMIVLHDICSPFFIWLTFDHKSLSLLYTSTYGLCPHKTGAHVNRLDSHLRQRLYMYANATDHNSMTTALVLLVATAAGSCHLACD